MDKAKIRVIIADDHRVLREGLSLLLEKTPDIEVISEASDGVEAISKTKELIPDVVLMDITMPGLSGLEAARQIAKWNPKVKILLLSVHESDEYLAEMLNIGLAGYILKTASGREVVTAIRAVYEGDIYLYPSLTRMLVKEYGKNTSARKSNGIYDGLTIREKEILMHIAEDKKNREIAEIMGLKIRTVQAHRTNLMDKLGTHDRTELVKYAIRKGIIEP
ncbi:response regulator [Chloroflexota bacterium]